MRLWWKNRHDNFDHYPRVLDKPEVTFYWQPISAAVSFDAYCCKINFVEY